MGTHSVWRDITELKREEEVLREADRRKNEFLGMLSHEPAIIVEGQKALRILSMIYIDVFRALPMLVVLIVIYYALPFVGMGMLAWMGVKAAAKRTRAG